MRAWLSFCCCFLGAVIALAGCFYDSRWGDDKKLQRARAAQSRPTLTTEAEPGRSLTSRPTETSKKTMRVRALVSRTFTVGSVDAPRHIRTMLEDANEILEPTLGVRLELESVRAWDLARDDDLKATLAEAKKADDGAEVDWVVGFVGSLSRTTRSFHDLGIGDVVGKYVVVRGGSSAERHDTAETYSELSDEERRSIRKGLERHRAAAVFLHEVGHTLGLVHERSARSIMFQEYGPRANSFSPESIAVMKVALEHRPPHDASEAAHLFHDLAAAMKRAPDGLFVDAEARQMVARYEDTAAKNDEAAQRQQAATQPRAPAIPETPELTPEHRAIFEKAYEACAGGGSVAAWTSMKPLFAAYPSSMPVQDLRCRLATQVLSFASARPECDAIMRLSK